VDVARRGGGGEGQKYAVTGLFWGTRRNFEEGSGNQKGVKKQGVWGRARGDFKKGGAKPQFVAL